MPRDPELSTAACLHDFTVELHADGCHWGMWAYRCRHCGGTSRVFSFSAFTCPACRHHPERPRRAVEALRLPGADDAAQDALHNLLSALLDVPELSGAVLEGVDDGLLDLTLTHDGALSRVDLVSAAQDLSWRPTRTGRKEAHRALRTPQSGTQVSHYALALLRQLGTSGGVITLTLEGPGRGEGGHCVPEP